MKLCFLADIRSIHTKRWLEFFAQDNEVHLITLDYPESEMRSVSRKDYLDMHIVIHTIPRKFPEILLNSLRVKKLVRSIKPDLLHGHFITHYGYWGAQSGFHPYVVSGWGDDVLIHPKKPWLACFVRYALNKADAVTCDGENSQRALMSLAVPQKKISLITHGVDTKKFTPLKRDRGSLKQFFGNEYPVVICVRGFDPIYNAETVIRAIPLVMKEVPEVNFILAGKGPEETKLRKLTDSLGLSSAINFCGTIPHDKLPSILASSDIFVSAALSDGGTAVSTFEAMASGLTVVVTDTGDNSLWVKNDENGFIIPVRSPEVLAERIVFLLERPDVRNRFGAKNRIIVIEKQDYYNEMEKAHILYQSLVSGDQ